VGARYRAIGVSGHLSGASGRLTGTSGRLSGASGHLTGASGHWFDRWGSVTVGGSDTVERVRSVMTGVSGHPEKTQ
jgi:hypothetical protein